MYLWHVDQDKEKHLNLKMKWLIFLINLIWTLMIIRLYYSVVYILLQYQNAFGMAFNKYSDAISRVGDIIPIYHCLQREILEIHNNIIAAFGTDTELGKDIGNISDNGRLVGLVQDAIENRYTAISKDLLLVGAYLICGDRMWEHQECPKVTPNLTSN